jgi:hypothetical protein
VTSLLALNFFPDGAGAVRDMRARTTARGVVSACVWDYAEGMQFLRYFWDAAVSIDPAASALDEGRRFPICRPAALVDLFDAGGLSDVRCEAIETPTELQARELAAASRRDWSGALHRVTGRRRRAELSRTLEEQLVRTRAGPITLTARAWAIRGLGRGRCKRSESRVISDTHGFFVRRRLTRCEGRLIVPPATSATRTCSKRCARLRRR